FSAAWRGESEVDRLNELVIRAGLTWRQVVILRTYARYLRQTGAVYSQEYMEQTFISYPRLAATLVALFETRFDPTLRLSKQTRSAQAAPPAGSIDQQLDAAASLAQDRILRASSPLIRAPLRTSFFQRSAEGRPKSYTAVKLAPQAIPDLPAPRP